MNNRSIEPMSWRLPVAVAPVGFGQTAFSALVPLIVAGGGISSAGIGLAAIVGTLAFVMAAPAWAGMPSVRDARSLLLAFAAMMTGAHLILLIAVAWPALATSLAFAALLISRALYGVAAAGLTPTAQAVAAQGTEPGDRAAGLARLGAGLSAGRILGSLVAVAAPLGQVVPFLLLALSPLMSLAAPSGLILAGSDKRVRLSPRDPRLMPFLIVGAVMTGCIGMMQIVLGLLFQTRFSVDATTAASATGALLTVLGVVMIVVQLAVARRRLRLKAMVVTGLFVIASGAAAVAAPAAMPLFIVGALLAGVGAAIAAPFAAAWALGRFEASEQRAVMGLIATSQVAGQGLGAALGGILFVLWPPLPFVASAVAALVAAMAVVRLRSR